MGNSTPAFKMQCCIEAKKETYIGSVGPLKRGTQSSEYVQVIWWKGLEKVAQVQNTGEGIMVDGTCHIYIWRKLKTGCLKIGSERQLG